MSYCFSGAKMKTLLQYIPSMLNCHPSAHTVIIHVDTNDMRLGYSLKVVQELEILAETIESGCKIGGGGRGGGTRLLTTNFNFHLHKFD